jgi:hypothetical protein
VTGELMSSLLRPFLRIQNGILGHVVQNVNYSHWYNTVYVFVVEGDVVTR